MTINDDDFRYDPVAFGLGYSPLSEATSIIDDALRNANSQRRCSASYAASIRLAPTLLPLIRTLANDQDLDVRVGVAHCLANYPLDQTLDDFTPIILRGGPPALKAIDTVRNALYFLRAKNWTQTAKNKSDTPDILALETMIFARFIELIPKAKPAIRVKLVMYFGQTQEHETDTNQLLRSLRRLQDDDDSGVRTAVAGVLSLIHSRNDRR